MLMAHGSWQRSDGGRGVLKGLVFFKGPPLGTAPRDQQPPTTTNCQPPTTNRQRRPTTNRQPLPSKETYKEHSVI